MKMMRCNQTNNGLCKVDRQRCDHAVDHEKMSTCGVCIHGHFQCDIVPPEKQEEDNEFMLIREVYYCPGCEHHHDTDGCSQDFPKGTRFTTDKSKPICPKISQPLPYKKQEGKIYLSHCDLYITPSGNVMIKGGAGKDTEATCEATCGDCPHLAIIYYSNNNGVWYQPYCALSINTDGTTKYLGSSFSSAQAARERTVRECPAGKGGDKLLSEEEIARIGITHDEFVKITEAADKYEPQCFMGCFMNDERNKLLRRKIVKAQSALTRQQVLAEVEKLFTPTGIGEPQNCWLVEKSEWQALKAELLKEV
jgi:hypothetical protein